MSTAAVVVGPIDAERRRDHRAMPTSFLLYAVLALVVGTLGFAAVQKFIAHGAGAFDHAISIGEVVVVALLLTFHRRGWAWVGMMALFAAFAGYTGYLLWRGETSCGCFGDVQTPPLATLSIDITLATLSAIVVMTLARSASIAGVLLTIAGVAAAAGAGFSVVSTEPLATDFHGDRAALLLAAPDLAAIAGSDLTDPDWLVYIYDPADADQDPALKQMRADAQTHAEDDALRVKVLSADQAEKISGVPHWAWEQLPAAILYRGGRVVQRYVAATMPDPQTLRTDRPVGPIAKVLAQTKYADILFSKQDMPAYLLYVYNPECPICVEHLVVMESFMDEHPNDPKVVVVPISMEEIEKTLGIPLWAWPGVPTNYVVRGGRVVAQTAGPSLIPNPYQIREDFLMGRPLRLPKPSDDGFKH